MQNIHKKAERFSALYRHFDHVLKRSAYGDRTRRRADVNWPAFADSLGPAFFEQVRDAGMATTLIGEPPRILMSESIRFEPEHPDPITDVRGLFIRGVCQVRHNYFHGEKFTGGAEDISRDHALICDAARVLELAAAHLAKVEANLAETGPARE